MIWAIQRGEYSDHEYVGYVATEADAIVLCVRLNTDLEGNPLTGYHEFSYTEVEMLDADIGWASVLTMDDWFDRDGAPIKWAKTTHLAPLESIAPAILGLDEIPKRGRVAVRTLFYPADHDRGRLEWNVARCNLRVSGANFDAVRKTFSDLRAQIVAQPERIFGATAENGVWHQENTTRGDDE